MNAKKLSALLLALCLALAAVPGLAAPTRDIKALEVTVDEKLTALAELAVNAAILQGKPFTNYGITIAYIQGILKRSVEIFPDIYKYL